MQHLPESRCRPLNGNGPDVYRGTRGGRTRTEAKFTKMILIITYVQSLSTILFGKTNENNLDLAEWALATTPPRVYVAIWWAVPILHIVLPTRDCLDRDSEVAGQVATTPLARRGKPEPR